MYRLPVAESFYSVQGEGCNSGKAAYFLRLGGCNVHCPWCDSKSTWDSSKFPLCDIESIVAQISATPATNVVITGGEPLMHDLAPLCEALKAHGYNLFLETSGTCPVSGCFDWICVSPKKHCPPLKETLLHADELKVVISEKADFAWAEANKLFVNPSAVLLLQPEWNGRADIMPDIVEYVKAHPEWRISLQTHKYLNIP